MLACRFVAKEYTFADTTPVTLTQILGLGPEGDYIGTFSARAGIGNATDIWIGDAATTSAANRGVYLSAGDSWGFDLMQKFVNSNSIYLVGGTGLKVHILWIQ